MGIANNVPEFSLAMARAAAGPASAAHLPSWVITVENLPLWVIAAGLIAGFSALYRASLWLHPMRSCRRCGGSGRTAGWWPGSAGFCGRCDNGLVPRLGTRVLDLAGKGAR